MKFSWRVGRKGMASSGAPDPVGSWRVLGVDVEVSMVAFGDRQVHLLVLL